MRRRGVLALVGSTVVTGCFSLGGSTEPPEAEDTTIDVVARNCVDSGADTGTVTFGSDGRQVTIDGTIRVPRTDQVLYVDTVDGIGYEDRANDEMEVRIQYMPPDADATVGGSDCEGTLEYETRITFSAAPSAVILRHLAEDGGEAILETVTTAEP